MSYDIWLVADLGGPEPSLVSGLDWNYTSNCAPMWRKAMPETDGLAGMDGMEAGEAAEVLDRGITAMRLDRESYRALNPPNGWGDFDRQLEALETLWRAFIASPKAKVRIWR